MMVDPDLWVRSMGAQTVSLFTGVPCSLLASFCSALDELAGPERLVVAANEGGAVALAIGAYLGSGRVPVVYLQNSGLGNAVNPIASLSHPRVYSIPMVLIIGWRGEREGIDEPQHELQGAITPAMLDLLGVPACELAQTTEAAIAQTEQVIERATKEQRPHAILVRRGTLSPRTSRSAAKPAYPMPRARVVESVAAHAPRGSVIVSTTGMTSRELLAYREQSGTPAHLDFLVVGGMGHASQIALGLAMSASNRAVFCLDGDGAMLMHLGSLPIIGSRRPHNLVHVLLNNGVHDSVGGQPTVAPGVSFVEIARACGYRHAAVVWNERDLELELRRSQPGPSLLDARVSSGAEGKLPRPAHQLSERARAFTASLRQET